MDNRKKDNNNRKSAPRWSDAKDYRKAINKSVVEAIAGMESRFRNEPTSLRGTERGFGESMAYVKSPNKPTYKEQAKREAYLKKIEELRNRAKGNNK